MRRTVKILATTATLLAMTGAVSAGDTHQLDQRQRALHVLNRLSFGPRPGDVDKVLKDGIDTWIDEQLNPDRIPDRAIEARLKEFPTLQMSEDQIVHKFYVPLVEVRKEAAQMAKQEGANASKRDFLKEMREKLPPDQRPAVVTQELIAQRILRAADSDRQLNEVMVDFWMNHFNVFAGKGVDRFLLTSYERDTIRPHIWGRFEDLLMATAKSPAMLFYLDNARSVADPRNRPALPQRARFGRGGFAQMPRRAQNQNKGGLNENYAREIMELHTLGVDGGYTQKDVTELARVFTGWSITRPEQGATFIFRRNLHDVGAKTVLGVHFAPGGGMEEGERMIHILAHAPATAHHISYELCQRLVSDDPPPALVDRVAKTFLVTDGDLRQTVKAIIDSPEFWDPRMYRAKVKSPFEYVISALRATNATVDDPKPIARALQQMGEPLYGSQPPTGYGEKGNVWINTGALISRLNFALALAANRLPGVREDVTSLIPPSDAADASRSVDALAAVITGGNLTDATRGTIKSRIVERKAPTEDPWDNTQTPMVAGLILGSPEFQRR